MGLTLTLRPGEEIWFDVPPSKEERRIVVQVVSYPRGDQVKLSSTADKDIVISRPVWAERLAAGPATARTAAVVLEELKAFLERQRIESEKPIWCPGVSTESLVKLAYTLTLREIEKLESGKL